MYTGLVYNDAFSKSINLFGSQWYVPQGTAYIFKQKDIMLDPKNAYYDAPYSLGLDPVWQVGVHTRKLK